MTFRQILAQFNPIETKNSLNDLLALIERNFGVFSPDMELDIKAIISKPEVEEYFLRIIHEAHPQLEYDKPASSKENRQKKALPLDEIQKKKQKPKAKKEKKESEKQKRRRELKEFEESMKGKTKEEIIAANKARVAKFHPEPDMTRYSTTYMKSLRKLEHEKSQRRIYVSIVSIPMGGLNKH